jgi:hypothetical protein
MMTNLDSTLMRPATKAAVMLFTGTALVLACFAPAIANQKEQSRYDTHNSHRPIIVGYLA